MKDADAATIRRARQVADGDLQYDPGAHAVADDVGLLDPEVLEQRCRVVGHLLVGDQAIDIHRATVALLLGYDDLAIRREPCTSGADAVGRHVGAVQQPWRAVAVHLVVHLETVDRREPSKDRRTSRRSFSVGRPAVEPQAPWAPASRTLHVSTSGMPSTLSPLARWAATTSSCTSSVKRPSGSCGKPFSVSGVEGADGFALLAPLDRNDSCCHVSRATRPSADADRVLELADGVFGCSSKKPDGSTGKPRWVSSRWITSTSVPSLPTETLGKAAAGGGVVDVVVMTRAPVRGSSSSTACQTSNPHYDHHHDRRHAAAPHRPQRCHQEAADASGCAVGTRLAGWIVAAAARLDLRS